MKLRVWWIRQVPNKPEYFEVKDIAEALAKLRELERADLANKSIQSNAGGLEIFKDESWEEYYGEEGRSIDEITEADLAKIESKGGK